MDRFSVILDHAQQRVVKDRLYTQITGKYQKDRYRDERVDGWDFLGSLDADDELQLWCEPVTGKLLFRPLQLTRLWQSTMSSDRITIADLDISGTDWEDHNYNNQAAISVRLKDSTASEEATTDDVYTINRPFFVNPLFQSTVNSDSRQYIECGWGTFLSGVTVRLYVDGAAQVYKDGEIKGNYSWSDGSGSGKQQKANGERVGFVLLPCQPNELIVVSTWGGGFSHVFDDLDPLEYDNTITPAATFRFQCFGMATDVELAPCTFAESGYIYSIPTWFASPPVIGDTPEFTYFVSPPAYGTSSYTASLVEIDSPYDPFVPDDVENGCRIKQAFTGDGTNTPFMWSVASEFPSELGTTPEDEELDVTAWCLSLRISSCMDPSRTEAQFTLRAPEDIQAASEILNPGVIRDLETRENRPVKIMLGDLVIIDGVAGVPGLDRSTDDNTTVLHFTVKSKWALLEEYRFSDPTPFDGLDLRTAFEAICDAAAVENDIDAEAENIDISLSSRASTGDWAVVAEPRQSADQILREIFEQYIGDWYFHDTLNPAGEVPDLTICPVEQLSPDFQVTIFDDIDNALAAHSDDVHEAKHYVYRAFNTKPLQIECNQLFVHGREPATGKPIIVKMEDLDSQDPTINPKPDNWTGTIRKAAVNCPGLRTQAACEEAIRKLWKKTAFSRKPAEWDSQILIRDDNDIPIWIGDGVFISSETSDSGVYRVQSLDWDIFFEPDEESGKYVCRRAHYMGELIQDQDDSSGLGRIDQFAKELASHTGRWAPKGLPTIGFGELKVGMLPAISREAVTP